MTDTLLAAFKRIMSMSDFQTSFVQYAFYGVYFCFALPAALLIEMVSYKVGVLVGLALFILGALLFYPASQTMAYGHFLIALYVLAAGLSFLETSANPYVLALGAPETATQRLNLAQSFNPVGSVTGVALSQVFILSNLNEADAPARAALRAPELEALQRQELGAVMGPYVGVACVLILVLLLIIATRMPNASDSADRPKLMKTVSKLAQNRNYIGAVIAQFFYVGAQIAVWSFSIRYVMAEIGGNEASAANYYLAGLALYITFRFICTALMRIVSPRQLLLVFAVMAATLSCAAAFTGEIVGVYSLVAISACMSLMFPTICGIGLSGLGSNLKIGSAGLIMAIIGGAVITGGQALLSDATGSIRLSYIVPAGCFLVVAWFAFFSPNQPAENN